MLEGGSRILSIRMRLYSIRIESFNPQRDSNKNGNEIEILEWKALQLYESILKFFPTFTDFELSCSFQVSNVDI